MPVPGTSHRPCANVRNEPAASAIHVVDETGDTVWRGKRASDPEVLATALRRHAPELVRFGLETGPLTPWLYHSCKALGLPILCLDARHARAATALQRNKTDARDAETLAQLVRTGWYREARVKSYVTGASLTINGSSCSDPVIGRRLAMRTLEDHSNNFNAVEIPELPVAVTVFPGEIYRAPKSWVQRC